MIRPSRTVSSTLTTTSEVMTPNDANFLGKVFGGRLLALVDLCAYVTAARFSGEVCVTASFDRVDFHEPIEVGEVVTLTGLISYVGRTSMEVTIEVHAENIFRSERRHTNTARVTMVAIKDGKPVEVPKLEFENREEVIRFLLGKSRRTVSATQSAERKTYRDSLEKMADEELFKLLEAT